MERTAVLILTFLVVALASNGGQQLDYRHQNHWGGVCTTGKKQSPIEIPDPSWEVTTEDAFLELPKDTFTMTNLNNANTAKYGVNPAGSTAQVPWLGDRKVNLVQLHLHWGATAAHGSEHMIRGRAFAAESHLVTSYTASDGTTKYMVFARLFEQGPANPQIAKMIKKNKALEGSRDIAHFDLDALYPSDTENWLTYQGGLTTPPCTEIVHWVIVTEPLTISKKQLHALRRMHLGSGHMAPLTRNWRNTQPLNGRQSTWYHRG